MMNLFNRKTRKQLEETIRILQRKVDIRDVFIDRILYERDCMFEENDELKNAGFELQKDVLELKQQVSRLQEEFEKKSKSKRKGAK